MIIAEKRTTLGGLWVPGARLTPSSFLFIVVHAYLVLQ
jgi:hypothetical protein